MTQAPRIHTSRRGWPRWTQVFAVVVSLVMLSTPPLIHAEPPADQAPHPYPELRYFTEIGAAP